MVKLENRYLTDLKEILFDKGWLKTCPDFTVYQVKRGVKYKDCLRYDETSVFPRLLGKEFPKTKGHEHPKECLELIEVLKGKAIFLLQKDEKNIVEDAYFINGNTFGIADGVGIWSQVGGNSALYSKSLMEHIEEALCEKEDCSLYEALVHGYTKVCQNFHF